MIQDKAQAGFVYTVEEIRGGQVVSTQIAHNILPVQGVNHMLDVLAKGGTQIESWYLMLYENDYAPVSTDVAATFPSLAGESTAYVSPTRHEIQFGNITGGSLSNVGSRIEVEFTADRTIRGGAIVSTAAKGSTAGILLSAVRFPSPRQVDANTILRVTAGIQIVSA